MKNVQICEGVEGTWHYHLCPSDDDTGTKSLCGKRTMSSPAKLSSWGFKPSHMPASYCEKCESIATAITKTSAMLRNGKTLNQSVPLFRELDMELDGVLVPSSAAAILNAIRLLLTELEDE